MNKLQKLLDKRAALLKQARGILDKADEETRDLNSEERNQYDAIMVDFDTVDGDIKRIRQMENAQEAAEKRGTRHTEPVAPGEGNEERENVYESEEYRSSVDKYLRSGDPAEIRAMSIGTDANGGYLVPTDLDNAIIRALPDVAVVMKYAKTLKLMHDRDIPVTNSKGVVYWKDEAAEFAEATPTHDKKTLGAYKLTYLVKLSEELVADAGYDLFGELAKNYADLAGVAMDTKFCQGTGSSQIQGLITGGSAGKTAAAATAFTADEIIDLYYSLAKQYRNKAVWLGNSATAKAMRKLKNATTGEYLWQPALAAGQPDTLIGSPYEETVGMPDIAASASPLIIGDLSYYLIAQRGTRSVQRLNELYAANGQVGFRVFERLDGAVALSAAIKKLTMAAS